MATIFVKRVLIPVKVGSEVVLVPDDACQNISALQSLNCVDLSAFNSLEPDSPHLAVRLADLNPSLDRVGVNGVDVQYRVGVLSNFHDVLGNAYEVVAKR